MNDTKSLERILHKANKALGPAIGMLHGAQPVYGQPDYNIRSSLAKFRSTMTEGRLWLGAQHPMPPTAMQKIRSRSIQAFYEWKRTKSFRAHWRISVATDNHIVPWSWHTRPDIKVKEIVIKLPSSWSRVAERGLTHDGNKLVQMMWNETPYNRCTVWDCRYYDMSDMDKITHYTGYLVKNSYGCTIGETFADTLALANSRERRAVASIIMKAG